MGEGTTDTLFPENKSLFSGKVPNYGLSVSTICWRDGRGYIGIFKIKTKWFAERMMVVFGRAPMSTQTQKD